MNALSFPHLTGLHDKKSPSQESFATSLHRHEGKTTVTVSRLQNDICR